MYPQHNPHPYPPRYNPTNPLGRGAKIALAVLGVGVVGTGVYLLWPSEAKASDRPTPTPTPKPPTGQPKRPPGSPPPQGGACMPPDFGGQNSYDAGYWNSTQKILDAFQSLGYQTPTDRPTMNRLGPDGKLGGGDDVPNAEVTRFQRNYNSVSSWGKFLSNMRGLDPDGKVGPCTLNAMKYVMDNLNGQKWSQIVAQAI